MVFPFTDAVVMNPWNEHRSVTSPVATGYRKVDTVRIPVFSLEFHSMRDVVVAARSIACDIAWSAM